MLTVVCQVGPRLRERDGRDRSCRADCRPVWFQFSGVSCEVQEPVELSIRRMNV